MEKEIIKLEQSTDQILKEATEFVITTQEQYEVTAQFYKSVDALIKEVHETFDPIVKEALNTHRISVAQRKKHLEPLEQAKLLVRKKCKTYEEEMERQRKAEEERIRKENEKKAEAERKKLEKKAEKEIANGNEEKAEELLDKAEEVTPDPVIATPKIDRVKGLGIREVWDFRVVDEKKVPRNFLMIDYSKVKKVVTALKKDTDIPGIEAYKR